MLRCWLEQGQRLCTTRLLLWPAICCCASPGACLLLARRQRAARRKPKPAAARTHHSQVAHSGGATGGIRVLVAGHSLHLLLGAPPALAEAVAATADSCNGAIASSMSKGQQRCTADIGR